VRVISRSDIESVLDHAGTIDLMRRVFHAFAEDKVSLPDRVSLEGADPGDAVLVMPAAVPEVRGLGAKLISIFPSNAARGLPTISSQVILLDAQTGVVRAALDGASITELRTSAVSALATDILARKDAHRLTVFGAGVQARNHIQAIMTVRKLDQVSICSRTAEKARDLARTITSLTGGSCRCEAVADTSEAVRTADIIVTATTSVQPVFDGSLLQEGTHVNAIGSFKPHVRELDDATVTRSRIFVDIPSHALREAGDLMDPIARGVIGEDAVLAGLGELVTGRHPGRTMESEITLFKSVGAAMEDIIVAAAVCDRLSEKT